MTREEWLLALTDKFRLDFELHGKPIPETVRISVGLPSKRALSLKNKRIGEHWSPKASADGVGTVFISPVLGTAFEAAEVLVHELVHAAIGNEHGHKAPFRRLALDLGLTGKMTATKAGTGLTERLNALIAELGPYPHALFDPLLSPNKKKEGTRLVKLECEACGYLVRTTVKWIDLGIPTCYCGGEFYVPE